MELKKVVGLPEIVVSRPPDQVAFLVEDIEESMRGWSAAREGDWRLYLYDQELIKEPTYRGRPGDFSMRLALLGSGPQIELIQPLDGPSIYHDWIAEHGYGFHHLGYFVPSLDEAVQLFAKAGLEPIQTGRGYGLDGDGGFAYFDTIDQLGMTLEVIEVPQRRRPSLPVPNDCA